MKTGVDQGGRFARMKARYIIAVFFFLLVFFMPGCREENGESEEGRTLSAPFDAASSPASNSERDLDPGEFAEGQDGIASTGLAEETVQELLNRVSAVPESQRNEWERATAPCIRSEDVCVPDAETALALGSVLLTRYQKQGFFSGALPQEIAYQEDPAIWILSCGSDPDQPNSAATVRFAIRRDNAQVVRIWLGKEEDGKSSSGEAVSAPFVLSSEKKESLLRQIRLLPENERNCWEQISDSCIFTEPCIPDAETALYYGNALLQHFQREGFYPRYIPQWVMYQTDPVIWIVSCWEDLGPATLSSTVSFAISETDAEIICIWLGE